MERYCALCANFEETDYGMGHCRMAELELRDSGKHIASVTVAADAEACGDFEAAEWSAGIYEEYGLPTPVRVML